MAPQGQSPRLVGALGHGSEASLASTIALVASGDHDALAAFYDATVSMVYTIAERLMRDPFQAEEAVLDVYNYVWERASNFDARRGTVGSWLATITRGRSLDRLRAASARHAREESLQDRRTDAAVSSGGPEVEAVTAERNDALERALAALPAAQRRVVELAFLHGKTHETIANELGEPLGTIKSQIRRGLLRLHDLLGHKEQDR